MPPAVFESALEVARRTARRAQAVRRYAIAVQRSDSLGLQLVFTLAQQLDADLIVTDVPGAAFQLTFEEEAA